jgi:hypothetical protein
MQTVIVSLAKNFVPAVQCICNRDRLDLPPHGDGLYMPTLSYKVNPNFQFALKESTMLRAAQDKVKTSLVDLDETSSISEYCGVFEQALRFEYEEHLRLYELYSLYHIYIDPMDECPHPMTPDHGLGHPKIHRTARLVIDGIADARPTLQIGDIVLLRPIPVYEKVSIEIESRIVRVVRGQTKHKHWDSKMNMDPHAGKDMVIIQWGLSQKQTSYLTLKHSPNSAHTLQMGAIKFNVRFIPSAAPLERCLTALDWLKNVAKQHPSSLHDVLFPVKAPQVKPLSPDEISRLKQDNSDTNKPLNGFGTDSRSRI